MAVVAAARAHDDARRRRELCERPDGLLSVAVGPHDVRAAGDVAAGAAGAPARQHADVDVGAGRELKQCLPDVVEAVDGEEALRHPAAGLDAQLDQQAGPRPPVERLEEPLQLVVRRVRAGGVGGRHGYAASACSAPSGSTSRYPTPQTLTMKRSPATAASLWRRRQACESSVRVCPIDRKPHTPRNSSSFL